MNLQRPSSSQSRVALVTFLGSGALSAALLAAYVLYGSQLAFAQFADSFLDVVTSAVLAWTVYVSALPEDANHHFGHQRAQPLGALVTAVLTGVLAIEAIERAVTALVTGASAEFDSFILWAFLAKIGFKLGILVAARKLAAASRPAMKALAVDARNDILTSGAAVVAYFAARYGYSQLDAWLALPLAGLIAWSGLTLALENIGYLMGQAPTIERQQEILALVRAVSGVRGATALRAQYVGTEVHTHVEITVDSTLTVGQAHDIGEAVRLRLEAESDVGRCSVHIDPAQP